MIIESKWLLSGAQGANGLVGQDVTGTGAVISSNVIDLGTVYGGGPVQAGFAQDDLFLVIAAQAASGGTTPGITIAIETATDAAFTTPVAIGQTTVGPLKSGDTVVLPLPYANLRYLRLKYTQTGSAPTNKLVAALTTSPQQWVSTPDTLAP